MSNNLHVTITPFLPSKESRIKKEVKTIIKSPNISKVFIVSKNINNNLISDNLSPNILIERISLRTFFSSFRFLSQGIKYFEFILKVFIRYYKMDVSVVNLHSYSLLPLAPLFKFFCKSKIIYDAHELETEKHGLNGVRKKIAKIIEYTFIRYTDEIIVVSESISNWYVNKYKVKKPVTIYNYPDVQNKNLKIVIDTDYFRNKFKIRKDQTIFLYQGGLLRARGVDKLLKAFESLNNDKNVCVFMGYGELETSIKEVSKSCNLVHFHSAVPSEDLLYFTSCADIGIHLIPNSCLNHDYCMPNKLFEYLNARLPVLVSNVKEMSNFVNKNKVGLVTDTTSVKDIISILEDFQFNELVSLIENVDKISFNCIWSSQEESLLALY